jgi:hypothetical protein
VVGRSDREEEEEEAFLKKKNRLNSRMVGGTREILSRTINAKCICCRYTV